MIFTPLQCRMARAALGWGVRELAAAAKVSTDTVARFERGDELKERTIDALQRALEAAGIEFTNGDQPGVRLTKAAAARSAEPGSAQSRRVAAKVVRGKRPRRTRRNDKCSAECPQAVQIAIAFQQTLSRQFGVCDSEAEPVNTNRTILSE